jgi:hypothetical protein
MESTKKDADMHGRRRVLVVLLLAWLTAAICGREPMVWAADQEVRFDLSAGAYADVIARARDLGLAPVQVGVYQERGEPRFAVVLQRGVTTPWIEKHLLTPQEFQDQFDAYLGQGYRPVSLGLIEVRGQPRLSAIWQKRAEPGWQLSTGVAPAQFDELAAVYGQRQLQPAVVAGVEIEGRAEFVVLWEVAQGVTQTQLSLSARTFREEAAARQQMGYRPRSVQVYRLGREEKMAVVWSKLPGEPTREVRALASRNELTDLLSSQQAGRLRIESLSTTMVDGQPAFTVILDKPRP